MLNYKQETCHKVKSDTRMDFDLSVMGFSADEPHDCQFHSPLPPFFPPPTASFNPEATFLNYSSCREKIKIILRRQLRAV